MSHLRSIVIAPFCDLACSPPCAYITRLRFSGIRKVIPSLRVEPNYCNGSSVASMLVVDGYDARPPSRLTYIEISDLVIIAM